MKTRCLAVLVAALAVACSHAQVGPPPAAGDLAITHATVIDATGAPPRPETTILVDGDRIARIGPSDSVNVPAGARVLDARGKFVIPGLADMHVHVGSLGGEAGLRRLTASGVTTIRDMGTPVDEILALRERSRQREPGWPRMVVAGPVLQGPLPVRHPLVRTVSSPEGARAIVAELVGRGVDFIKIGETVTPPLYAAIADEARRRRVPFAGHLPAGVSALEASRAGQRSIEHFGSAATHGLLISCSTAEAELRTFTTGLYAAAISGELSPDAVEARLQAAEFIGRVARTYSAARAADLFSTFARRGTWQVPTLSAIRWVRDSMRAQLDRPAIEAGDQVWARYVEMIAGMKSAGVQFLAGSDVPWRDGQPAAPLHDELTALVEAGLTPMEALQSATRNPAEYLGTLATQGTIEVGKAADLVVLDASPLVDISSTRRIRAVVRAGKLIDRGR